MIRQTEGTPSRLVIPLLDQAGAIVTATCGCYRVTDENDVELVATTALEVTDPIDTVELEISGAINTLEAGVTHGLRVILFDLMTETGSAKVVFRYLVVREGGLKVMHNSFQTFSQAILRSTQLTDLEAWDAASDDRKQVAMIDSYRGICKLPFRFDFENDQTRIIDKIWSPRDLQDLTESQFMNLEVKFRNALCLAQIAEANVRLGGGDVSDLRREGLMSATVGEVSQMFRPGKPLDLPVSARALRELSGYLSWSGRVSR